MNTHRSDLWIDHLHKALASVFRTVVENDRAGKVPDFPAAWVDFVASALDEVRLTGTRAIDADSPPLQVLQIRRIRIFAFYVARSGMGGGPAIDVLLHLWFDTEEMSCGHGVPLIFRKIPQVARMPDLIWSELQETCRRITLATP